MMDILQIVYDHLIENEYIKEQAFGRIKYYEYPETANMNKPFIIIDPIYEPTPADFADNEWLKWDCELQVEAWSKDRQVTRNLAKEIRDVFWHKLGFHEKVGPNEYDRDSGIFRIANRYKGVLYTEKFNKE